MKRWGALLALILWASVAQGTTQTINTIPSSGASFLTTLQAFLRNEDANRYDLLFNGVVVSGCTHSTGAGLTGTISSCVAFPGGYYVSDSGTVTYNDNDTCWVAVSADTTAATIDNFVRSGSSHFLVDCDSASLPTIDDADNAIIVMTVDTSGGDITSEQDLFTTVPYGNVSVNQGIRSNATGKLEGVSLLNGELLIGATGAKPSVGTLTEGVGIDITNGSGSITIAAEQDIDSGASPSFNRLSLTVTTGTAPMTITSQTVVPNLNVDLLDGKDWAAPAALGSTTPAAVTASTLKVPSSSGSAVTGIYKGTATIDFGSTLDGDCTSPSAITVTGATAGDAVFLGAPVAAQGSGRFWVGYVSATNTVSASFCNMSGSTVDPDSGTYTAWVIQ